MRIFSAKILKLFHFSFYFVSISFFLIIDDDDMMMMMNCFCGMIDQRKAFGLISSQEHCQRSSPLQISNMQRAGFQPAQNVSSSITEWNYAVGITTTPQRYNLSYLSCKMLPQKRFSKSDNASNDTIFYSERIFTFFRLFVNDLL